MMQPVTCLYAHATFIALIPERIVAILTLLAQPPALHLPRQFPNFLSHFFERLLLHCRTRALIYELLLLLQECFGKPNLLSLSLSLFFGLELLSCGYFFGAGGVVNLGLKTRHMIRHTLRVQNSLRLPTPLALSPKLEVVILAPRALPAVCRKIEKSG